MQFKYKYFIAFVLAFCWQVVFAAPPLVVDFTPNSGAINQPNFITLTVEFDNIVIPKLGNILIRRYGSGAIVESIAAGSAKVTGGNTRTITISPDPLALGTHYYVEIEATAFATVTNEFYAGTVDRDTWDFTTYTSAGDLRLWLDASEQGSLIYDGSNRIIEWQDLSGNNFHLNQTTPSRRPSLHTVTQSGKQHVRFVNSYLENLTSGVPIVDDTSRMTYFVVHQPEVLSSRRLLSTNEFQIRMNQISSFTPNVNTNYTFNTGHTVTTVEFDGSTMTLYNDSQVSIQNTNQAIESDIMKIRLGANNVSGGLSGQYQGRIQELRIYSEVFSDAERRQIEKELYDKWFGEPKEHANLLMWFDASDAKTYSFTPASKIGYWVNRADNSIDAYKETGISAPFMVDNGQNDLNTFNFSKDDSLRIDYALPEAGKTVFYVMQSKVLTSALQRAFFSPGPNSHHSVRINNDDFIYGDAITSPEDDVWRMHTTVYTGTNVEVYSNAVFIDDQPFTPKGTGPYLTIGDDGKGIRAHVAEIIVYDRILPESEIAQIETYLTHKWDLPAFFAEEYYVEDNDENAGQDQVFHILFSQNFRFVAGDIRLRRRDDNTIFATFNSGSPEISRSGRYLNINVTGMDPDTEYYFEIDPGFVESLDSVPYEGITDNSTWNFRTLPFDLDGLVLWLDADDDTTFDLNGTDRVISWFDKSVDEREVYQVNNTYRPVRIPYSRKPGMHVLQANNADLDLINGGLATYDIFQVFRTSVSNDFVGYEAIVGAKTSALRTYLTQPGTNRFHTSYAPGEIYQDGKLVTDLTLLDLEDFTAVYTEAMNPGAVRDVFINRREGSRGYTYLAEILVFDRKKSAANRDGVFAYLMDKWDLTGPKVISTNPVDNEAKAAITAANNISLEFDRPIFAGASGDIELRRSSDDSVVASLAVTDPGVSIAGSVLNLNFATALLNDTDYYLYLEDNTIQDGSGFPIKKYDEKPDFFNFKTVKAAPGAFSVKDINGLQLWYDAADYGTFDFSSGVTVQGIEDKSGNQRDARQASNGARARIDSFHQNGHDTLSFARGDFYYEDNSMFKAVDIFQVFQSPYNLFDYYGSYAGSRLSAHRDYLLRYRGDNFHTLPADSYYKDSVLMTPVNELGPVDEFMLVEAVTDNDYKRDYQLSRQEGHTFSSYLGEHIIFDRKLTDAERDQVTDYLIRKWNISPLKLEDSNPRDNDVGVSVNTPIELTFNLPVLPGSAFVHIRDQLTDAIVQSYDMSTTVITQPSSEVVRFNLSSPLLADTRYYIEIEDDAFATAEGYGYNGFNGTTVLNFKTTGAAGVFEPDDLNGLELWLDAQDQGSISSTASFVTQWSDKSFNDRHAEMTNATYRPRVGQYTDKFGNEFVSFTNDYMELQNNGFIGKTIFYVYRSDSYLFNTYGAVLGAQSNAERAYLFRSGGDYFHSDPRPEVFFNDGDSEPNTALFGYIKRPQVHMIQPYQSSIMRDWRVGAAEGYRATMQIGEIIAYNRDLSSSERNDVTRYLMNKWNLSAPKIVSLSPRDNDVVDSLDVLSVTFDEAIFAGTGNVSIRNVDTGAILHTMDISTSGELNITGTTLIIDLASPITAQGKYYVHVEGGALVDSDNLPYFELEDPTRYSLTITSNPFVYNGLQLWLDSADGSSVTTAPGSKVSNWLDKSTNTRHAFQDDINKMPTWGAVTQNGHNTMSFVDDTFELEDEDFQAVEIIQIFQVDAPEVFDNQTTILSNYQDIERGHKFENGASKLLSTPAVDYIQRNLEDVTANRDLFPTRYFFVNSVVQNHYNPTFDHNIASYSNQYFRGNLAEMMVFDRRLSPAHREQLIVDLATKWDIDIYPPEIISFDPADDSMISNLFQNLTITFDEPVYPTVGNISIIRETDGYILETIEVNSPLITGWGTNVITIDPVARLLVGSHFYVTIDDNAITDQFYNRMQGIGTDHEDWDFDTERDPNDIFFRWKSF